MSPAVLSIAKLVPDQATYYERSVAAGRDDYYSGRGEAPGRWIGAGAAQLGLSGELADGALSGLLRFELPGGKGPLRRGAPAREIAVTSLDPATGAPVRTTKELAPVAGFDLVFSTPKSLSVLEQLADQASPEGRYLRDAVAVAHRAGVAAALDYLEQRACLVRAGAGGARTLAGDGFLAAAFDHRTSRAQDPHRHTHVIIANLARADDGKWRSLDGRALLETERLAAGYLYEAEVRRSMSEAGFAWGTITKGMAELDGMPAAVLAEFSTRRAQIAQHMADAGSAGHRGAQAAAQITRAAKAPAIDLPAARADWRARAAEHGLGAGEVAELARAAATRAGQPLALADPQALGRHLSGPAGLTELANTFARPEVVREIAALHDQGIGVDQVQGLVEGYLADRAQVVELAPGRYTSRDLLRVERQLLEHAVRRRRAGVGLVRPALTEAVLAERAGAGQALSAEQAGVVRAATTSGRGLELVRAFAGTGKTRVLGVMAAAYAAAGYEVVGVAPTGRAARELRSVGVPARTMDSLVATLDRGGGFGAARPVALLLDEAGMASTRLWARLAAHAEVAGAKLVAAGDDGQLASVPAGGALAALRRREGALSLTTVLRQRDPDERAALAALREPGGAIDFASWQIRSGRLRWGAQQEMVAAAVAEWARLQADLPTGQVAMISRDNALRAELNLAARTAAIAAGWVSGPELEVGDRAFGPGDRVIARRNDRQLDVDNGDRATVVEVDRDVGQVTARADDGRMLVLGADYLAAGHLEHAYALTAHGAQGGTVEHALVVGRASDHSRQWSYTAYSRGRAWSPAFLITDPRLDDDHDEAAAAAAAAGPAMLSPWREPIGDYLAALSRDDLEPLATDQADPRSWAPEWEAATRGPGLGRSRSPLGPDPALEPTPAHRPAHERGQGLGLG